MAATVANQVDLACLRDLGCKILWLSGLGSGLPHAGAVARPAGLPAGGVSGVA